MSDLDREGMSLAAVTRQAQAALAGSGDPALIMQVPSGIIIAASRPAAILLDPPNGNIVGHQLEEFTRDEPSGALALFADGRIDGYEAPRTLTHEDGVSSVHVTLWYRRFDHQSTSRFALVLITLAGLNLAESTNDLVSDRAPVVGTSTQSRHIEQVSRGTMALFGETPTRLLGRPISDLVDPRDTDKWNAATEEASIGRHAVTVVVRVRGGVDSVARSSGPVVCDVVLLPLLPGFTFIFLPADLDAARPPDSTSVGSMLTGLSRVAGLAALQRQRLSGLTDSELPGLSRLTPRELDMLTRLFAGYRVSSIATDLVLTPSTVRTHLASIFAKLGVSNQSDLLSAVRSSRSGLGWSELYPSWHDQD